jgi:hypothetical protein
MQESFKEGSCSNLLHMEIFIADTAACITGADREGQTNLQTWQSGWLASGELGSESR